MSKRFYGLKLAVFIVLVSTLLTGCFGLFGSKEWTVEGVVEDLDGNPIEGVTVLLDYDKDSSTVTTDENGEWSATVSGDSVTISVEKLGYTFETQEVTVEKDNKEKIVFVGAVVEELVISPKAGEYKDPVTVELLMAGDYTVYYTIDGSEPTAESTKYTGPFVLNESATVKAIAINNADASDTSSVEATYEVIKLNLLGNPGFEDDRVSYAPWEPNDVWGNLTKMKIDTEVFVEGKQSLYVYDRESQAHGPYQYVDLDPEKTYLLSFKLKYDDPAAPATKQFNATYRDWGHEDGLGAVFGLINGEAVNGEWSEISGTFKLNDINEFHERTDGVIVTPYIFIETPWRAEPIPEEDWMSFWVDDFTLIELE